MRGLEMDTGPRNIFLQVKNYGGICEVRNQPADGFELEMVPNPKTNKDVPKYVKKYRGVEALVVHIERYDTGDKYDVRYTGLKLDLNAAGLACVLDLPFGSTASNRFMKCSPNIDFSQPVEFRAWRDSENGVAFLIRQDGNTVPQKWSADNMGDMPPAVEKKRGGWDYTEQEDWLIEYMDTNIIPMVNALGNPAGEPPAPVKVTAQAPRQPQGAGLQQGGPEDEDEGQDGGRRQAAPPAERGRQARGAGGRRQPGPDDDVEDDEIPF
jgi:hypothetical protein